MGDVQKAWDTVRGKPRNRPAAEPFRIPSARIAPAQPSMLTAARNQETPGMAGDVTNATMLTGKRPIGPTR